MRNGYLEDNECPYCEGELNEDGGCDACDIADWCAMNYELDYDAIDPVTY